MKHFFKSLLVGKTVKNNILVTLNPESGLIDSVVTVDTAPKDTSHTHEDLCFPSMVNTHSHAFQFAMAGLGESHHLEKAGDFWSWRETMYELALSLTPEKMYAIARYLYSEMISRGFSHVCEFHYVHHMENGKPYECSEAMSTELLRAAKDVGMGITLIPVYYQNSNFDQKALTEQRRFTFSSIDSYAKFLDGCKTNLSEGQLLGLGAHSLRAASQLDLKTIFSADFSEGFAARHIHIAEQQKEIDDCLKAWGMRPVEFALENLSPDSTLTFVHATHVTDEELEGMAKNKVNASICPATEANLGDGIFPLEKYRSMAGRFNIGTDSHVTTCPFEELRLLDTVQRLVSQKRNIFCRELGGESAIENYFDNLDGSRGSSGLPSAPFSPGASLDFTKVDGKHPLFEGLSPEKIISRLVYSSVRDGIKEVYTNGICRSEFGKHNDFESITASYKKTVAH